MKVVNGFVLRVQLTSDGCLICPSKAHPTYNNASSKRSLDNKMRFGLQQEKNVENYVVNSSELKIIYSGVTGTFNMPTSDH